jgi:hypothetical protein
MGRDALAPLAQRDNAIQLIHRSATTEESVRSFRHLLRKRAKLA